MKANKLILSLILIINTISLSSQVTYTSNKMLGVNRAPSYPLDVQGNTRLNGYVGIGGAPGGWFPLNVTSYYGKTIMIDPSLNGAIIGASTGRIDFYFTSHNKLYANRYYTTSDSALKTNIKPLQNALSKIIMLNGYSYDYKSDLEENLKKGKSNRKNVGLIAQEVELILPEAISESQGSKMIEYDALIPLLVEAIKEQQAQINTLQNIVSAQEKEIVKVKADFDALKPNVLNSNLSINDDPEKSKGASRLEQNAPNPFTTNTEIRYLIDEDVEIAELLVHDINGVEVMKVIIPERGHGKKVIRASELKSGIYLYSILLDGKLLDSKRMVLTSE